MAKRNFSHGRGPTPFLSRLQLVQAHFGLSQQHVAELLLVPRATLTMDETGQRLLPLAATLRLDALRQQLPAPYGPAPAPPMPAPHLTEEEQWELQMRQRKIGLEEYSLEQALARSQNHLRQAQLRLQVLPALREALPDEWGQTWLNTFEAQAQLWLKYDTGTPALLELRLKVLAFEKQEIARLLAEAAPAQEPPTPG
ncbi:hypothetical protein [Hymenobacter elongatus]|uniref:Uncharacterized protein n=1 Tax=Hymenobacter elongatus TaxID=877208 RepID=A0A4Z0PM84_9BACT|nr:hypothetical protein [Hymenobacter elongatus]TGE15839.1 hypothetical protein E5J99_11635 [Hymenobacter elongatus]